MALCREALSKTASSMSNAHNRNWAKHRRKLKKWMNKYIRRQPIDEDDHGTKTVRKPTKYWDF